MITAFQAQKSRTLFMVSGFLLVELKAQNPNPKGSDLRVLVEMTGIEPVSEKRATLVSPGAVHLQDSPIGGPVNRPPLR